MNPSEFMVLAMVNDMKFLEPVLPGQTVNIEVNVLKMTEEAALIEGVARVEDTVVTRGKLSFARKELCGCIGTHQPHRRSWISLAA